MSKLLSWLTGGVIQQFTAPLLEAHRQRLAAQNSTDRIAAEQEIARLEAARDIALAEQGDRFSATRIGRLLIVVPFGLWWAAVFAVSIVNPQVRQQIAISGWLRLCQPRYFNGLGYARS